MTLVMPISVGCRKDIELNGDSLTGTITENPENTKL